MGRLEDAQQALAGAHAGPAFLAFLKAEFGGTYTIQRDVGAGNAQVRIVFTHEDGTVVGAIADTPRQALRLVARKLDLLYPAP